MSEKKKNAGKLPPIDERKVDEIGSTFTQQLVDIGKSKIVGDGQRTNNTTDGLVILPPGVSRQ